MSLRFKIAYDGTRYFGWQKTIAGPSIQEEIEKAIRQITGETVLPEAASRTDRGVHAEGQIIQIALEKPADPQKLLKGLNAVLPTDIRILEAIPDFSFHPTLDATGKEYHYWISLGPVQDPMSRLYAWSLHFPLDMAKMDMAISHLLGTHDFTAFANEEEKDPICTLESIAIHKNRFQIKGNRFLYKMVRNIVGTLVYIGAGKLPADSIPHILMARDRKKGGMTAPAHGLHLHQVFYPVKLNS